MPKRRHNRKDFGYRVIHDSTWAMAMHEGRSKVHGTIGHRLEKKCDFCSRNIPHRKQAECKLKCPSECPFLKPLSEVKRAKAATSAKVRKLCAGEQGSFSHIRKDIRAAGCTLKGNALNTLINEIFSGKKELRAVIISLAAKHHPTP